MLREAEASLPFRRLLAAGSGRILLASPGMTFFFAGFSFRGRRIFPLPAALLCC
ncbi:hypothetical protein [Hymenobacter koreensis]|uniref:hypothetical protein n=1 Tax=Hymenobacter koreensis TaxID=1084523 RepID=UPI0031E8432E